MLVLQYENFGVEDFKFIWLERMRDARERAGERCKEEGERNRCKEESERKRCKEASES